MRDEGWDTGELWIVRLPHLSSLIPHPSSLFPLALNGSPDFRYSETTGSNTERRSLMVKDNPPPMPRTDVADRSAARWRRFDGALRCLTLAAFVAFVVAAVWQFQLIREQLDRIDEQRVEHLYWTLSRPGTRPPQRTEAFQRLVALGHADWKAAVLSDMELERAALNGVSLRFANFDSCNLKKAQMRSSDVTSGRFLTCDLTEADLSAAELRECQLFKCTIRKTNLQRANLTRGSLEQSILTDANLTLATMPEAILLQTVFTDCNLSAADLTAADLTDAKFVRTDLRLARLTKAQFRNTDFTDSNWWRARGLTTLAIQAYKVRFPPSKNAPKEFRQDYELWLKTGGR
jgi:uncharacterized protein YjbI with pentapeptide repeats